MGVQRGCPVTESRPSERAGHPRWTPVDRALSVGNVVHMIKEFGIYRELAEKFQIIVDVLNEVREGERNESDRDLLRTYEIWLKTGSRRAAGLLRKNGVVPISDSVCMRSH